MYSCDQVSESFLEWEMFQTKTVEKIKKNISFSITFSENRALYEITDKDMAQALCMQDN
jgi:hypothetical protein